MATDWLSEALPVLEAVYKLQRELELSRLLTGVATAAVREQVELGPDPFDKAVIELVRADYLVDPIPSDSSILPTIVRLSERGLQVVANWPAIPGLGSYDVLVAAISARAEAATNDSERSGWVRVRDGLVELGRKTVTDLLAEIAAGRIPH